MSTFRIRMRTLCATVCLACGITAPRPAAGQLHFPSANTISPGDLLINDFFNGWLKFDPVDNQLYSLTWDAPSRFGSGRFAFDVDGAIVQASTGGTLPSVQRFHTVTGKLTRTGPIVPAGNYDLGVLPNGDFVLAKSATSASRRNDVWTGGTNGQLLQYSRSTGALAPTPKPAQFSPREVHVGPNGEVYLEEIFRDVVRIDLGTGALTDWDPLSTPSQNLLGIFRNGDLLLSEDVNRLDRLDVSTGAKNSIPFDEGSFEEFATDNQGNIWIGAARQLRLISGSTGVETFRLTLTSPFSPRAMLVVPADWTPPPVPEPASITLSGLAVLAVLSSRSSARARFTSGAPKLCAK